jgi:hypothetical protein
MYINNEQIDQLNDGFSSDDEVKLIQDNKDEPKDAHHQSI